MHRWANYDEWRDWCLKNNIGDKAITFNPALRMAFDAGREQANPITVANNHEGKE